MKRRSVLAAIAALPFVSFSSQLCRFGTSEISIDVPIDPILFESPHFTSGAMIRLFDTNNKLIADNCPVVRQKVIDGQKEYLPSDVDDCGLSAEEGNSFVEIRVTQAQRRSIAAVDEIKYGVCPLDDAFIDEYFAKERLKRG